MASPDVVGSFAPGTGGLSHPVNPTRVLDSRPAPNQVGPFNTPWGPNTTRDVPIAGNGGVPATGATAALLNVTVTGASATGFLTVWPSGQAAPLASSLNWVAGRTIPNSVTTKLGAGGAISVRNANGDVHVIADAAGWCG